MDVIFSSSIFFFLFLFLFVLFLRLPREDIVSVLRIHSLTSIHTHTHTHIHFIIIILFRYFIISFFSFFIHRKNQDAAEAAEDAARQAEMVRQIVSATGQIEAKEASEKYEEALMYAEANKQLALDAQHRRQRRKEEDMAANRTHVSNMRNSGWLTENPAMGLREGGVRRDQWKGMNVSQLQSHYDAQYDQIIEKQTRKQQQAADDAEFSERQQMIQDAMQQIVLKEQNEQVQMERNYRLHQAEQATRAFERKRDEVTTGAVTDEFFKYFGSSHR